MSIALQHRHRRAQAEEEKELRGDVEKGAADVSRKHHRADGEDERVAAAPSRPRRQREDGDDGGELEGSEAEATA